jgi:hypothetical protein
LCIVIDALGQSRCFRPRRHRLAFPQFPESRPGLPKGRRRDNGPELQKVLATCRKHKTQPVIAKLDRLSRNVAFIATMMD